jgi:tetratricopeptide (TPR) repeat protein
MPRIWWLALAATLLIAATPVRAADQEWNDCDQDTNLELRISACSRIISRPGESNLRRAGAFHRRGYAFGMKNEKDKAISDYNKSIEISPNSAHSYNNRGNIFREINQLDEALSDFNTAIRLNKSYTLPYYNRGLVY